MQIIMSLPLPKPAAVDILKNYKPEVPEYICDLINAHWPLEIIFSLKIYPSIVKNNEAFDRQKNAEHMW